MEIKEFIRIYESEKDIYTFWGEYVRDSILNDLKKVISTPIDNFLKINASARTKSIDSIIAKAYHRGKKYENPYEDITDKVGIRFIVLYLSDVRVIGKIVEANRDKWSFSKDRDYDEEREKNPDRFGYESLHYVVKNKKKIKYKNQIIPKNFACEIQIRTLLQHAYCEMSHENIYKKSVHNKVKRITARSMALIESSDYFFEEVKSMVKEEEKVSYEVFLQNLRKYYSTFSDVVVDDKINFIIIDSYRELIDDNTIENIKQFIESKDFLKQKIKQNYDIKFIYRQPTVLLIYYLIYSKRSIVSEKWPLTDEELRPLYNDLGYALGDL